MTLPYRPGTTGRPAGEAKFSIPSILAILSAIVSFFVGAGLSFFLSIAAIVLGALGVLVAISAYAGEQQRPASVAHGISARLGRKG